MKKLTLAAAALLASFSILTSQESGALQRLKSVVWPSKLPGNVYLVPTSQLLHPWGEQTLIAGRPADIALHPDQSLIAILNGRNIAIAHASTGALLSTAASRTTSYAGIAFRPNSNELWASEATRQDPDSILITTFDASGKLAPPQRLQLKDHAIPAQIAFSRDGGKAYVVFNQKNTLAVIDARTRAIEREIPVGLAPFGVVLSADEQTAYVSNRGGEPSVSGASAPSNGVAIPTDANGSVLAGSISVVTLSSGAVRSLKTGRAPTGLALSPDGKLLAVANSHSDSVSLIALPAGSATEVAIADGQPTQVAFHPSGARLYVTAAGINSVAVLDRGKSGWKLSGQIPTGWFPTAIAADRNGALRVACVKGVGSTANKQGTFNSREFEGSLLRFPDPSAPQLRAGAREVALANAPRFEPAGGIRDLDKLGIRHVFLIIKENRTYDQVFGDMPKGNGDKNLAIYGDKITPNHHALASKYVLLDNFHTGGAISFDGHQWLMQGFVNDHVERALNAAPRGYAWNMADALTVGPAGFFWQNARRPLNVRLLGALSVPVQFDPKTGTAQDIDAAKLYKWADYWQMHKDGSWRDKIRSRCGVPALAALYDPNFPPSETQMTDQIRADAFLDRLKKWEAANDAPNLVVMTTTSDHTMGKNPAAPIPSAMVADNDYAFGRIVEAISQSKFWPQSLILAVEDDAQDGIDHVDGHRTVAFAIGPHIRRNAVDSNYYTQLDMIRTIQAIFQVPAGTRYLRAARTMSSVFQAQPETSPYAAIAPRVALDEMNPPLKALKGKQRWAAELSASINWSDVDDVPTADLNRILWWEAKGYDTPYPAAPTR